MKNELKSRIMRRVYAIWFVRRIVPPVLSISFFCYLALHETAQGFFVAQIISNFLMVASNAWSIPGFIGAAMMHARPETLFIISFSILATFVLSVKLLRNIRTTMAYSNQALAGKVTFK